MSKTDEIESLVKKAKEKAAEKELSALHKVLEVEDDKILTSDQTFKELGVCDEICEAVVKMGYK
jgi:hypothetical protein|tara:strand:+ start:75 stop:266 length:192 start_codon:yes stop_codon:yes gene_type:complete